MHAMNVPSSPYFRNITTTTTTAKRKKKIFHAQVYHIVVIHKHKLWYISEICFHAKYVFNVDDMLNIFHQMKSIFFFVILLLHHHLLSPSYVAPYRYVLWSCYYVSFYSIENEYVTI